MNDTSNGGSRIPGHSLAAVTAAVHAGMAQGVGAVGRVIDHDGKTWPDAVAGEHRATDGVLTVCLSHPS